MVLVGAVAYQNGAFSATRRGTGAGNTATNEGRYWVSKGRQAGVVIATGSSE